MRHQRRLLDRQLRNVLLRYCITRGDWLANGVGLSLVYELTSVLRMLPKSSVADEALGTFVFFPEASVAASHLPSFQTR